MAGILIFSNNPRLITQWTHALIGEHDIGMLPNLRGQFQADVVLVDAKKLDDEAEALPILAAQDGRFLVIGNDWPEQKQIEVLLHGAAGYCDDAESAAWLPKAIASILNGDVWIRRGLVPKVIGLLADARRFQVADAKNVDIEAMFQLVDSLSVREREVADMIRQGENNKRIALAMKISERTVKAHLSSIFRKLNVGDRLHLAILLKEIDRYRKPI